MPTQCWFVENRWIFIFFVFLHRKRDVSLAEPNNFKWISSEKFVLTSKPYASLCSFMHRNVPSTISITVVYVWFVSNIETRTHTLSYRALFYSSNGYSPQSITLYLRSFPKWTFSKRTPSETSTIQFRRCDLLWSILLFNDDESEHFVHFRTKIVRSKRNNNFFGTNLNCQQLDLFIVNQKMWTGKNDRIGRHLHIGSTSINVRIDWTQKSSKPIAKNVEI